MKKWQMLKAIAGNIGMLMSYQFWRIAFTDKDYPVKSVILLVLFASCADILRLIFNPDYPCEIAD